MNKQEEITRLSKEKGYYVDKEGNLFNCKGQKLSTSKNNKGNGYLSFNIRLNGSKPTRSFIHRLQAFQKFGENLFDDNILVRHLNGVSTDNSYDNILIGTQFDNMLDIPKEQRILNASNPTHDHENIIKDRTLGYTYKQLMEKYGISSKGTISFILNKSLKINKE
jgi:hypothetical protein